MGREERSEGVPWCAERTSSVAQSVLERMYDIVFIHRNLFARFFFVCHDSSMLRVPSTISKVQTMSDGGLRLVVDTQELDDPFQKAAVMELHNQLGWFVFAPADIQITEADIPKERIDSDEQKTPGQRLRAVLYVMYEKKGKVGTFEEYYRKQMERIINQVKSKLEELT